MTFAVTPPGWRAWVLAHPRNLATRSTMDWIFASHRNSNPDGPMVLDAGGMGQVEGGKTLN